MIFALFFEVAVMWYINSSAADLLLNYPPDFVGKDNALVFAVAFGVFLSAWADPLCEIGQEVHTDPADKEGAERVGNVLYGLREKVDDKFTKVTGWECLIFEFHQRYGFYLFFRDSQFFSHFISSILPP